MFFALIHFSAELRFLHDWSWLPIRSMRSCFLPVFDKLVPQWSLNAAMMCFSLSTVLLRVLCFTVYDQPPGAEIERASEDGDFGRPDFGGVPHSPTMGRCSRTLLVCRATKDAEAAVSRKSTRPSLTRGRRDKATRKRRARE